MIEEQVKQALLHAGLVTLPDQTSADLSYYGLNSLTLALLIIELEKAFTVKIPVLPIEKAHFVSIDSISAYIKSLEAK